MSQVAHQAGTYPVFSSMKQLGAFLLPPGWDASPSQGYPRALRSAHTMGLVPATSPCNKLQGLVTSCELAIFASKSSCRDPATSPTNSNWFEFVELVAGLKLVPATRF